MRPLGLRRLPPSESAALVPIAPPLPLFVGRPRLRDCVKPFLVWFRAVRGRAASTCASYTDDLRCFIGFAEAIGRDDPAAITHREIEAYLAWLQVQAGRSAATAARRLHCLRTFFKYLAREDVVTRNPATDCYAPRAGKRLPIFLTLTEQEHVLAVLAKGRTLIGRRNYALVATLLLTGLRVAELCSLTLDDLDLEAGTLRVIGKGDKERELPVIPRLAAILRSYLDHVRPLLLSLRADAVSSVFVQAARGGVWPWRREGLGIERKIVCWILKRQVVPLVGKHISPHVLRHSFASRLRAAGADLLLMRDLLGHADVKTTAIYAHLSTPQRRAEVARLLGGAAARRPGPRHAPDITAWAEEPEPRLAGRRRRCDANPGPHVAVGDRLRFARRQAGLTIAALAAKTGAGRSTLIRVERGFHLPRAKTLQRIAETTGMSVDWLLTGADPQEGRA